MSDAASDTPLLSIGELAEKTGVSRRTVRYYVQRELIDPPVGLGRASGYTAKHVEQILRVQRLQQEGADLNTIQQLPPDAGMDEVSQTIASGGAASLLLRVPVLSGVRLEFDAGPGLPSDDVVARMVEACRRILEEEKSNGHGGDEEA